MSAPARFTQTDVTRAMKGARKAGFSAIRVVIEPGGNIVMEASEAPNEAITRRNPLDRVLKGVR
ncbi:hypothetical protein [Novosphingobium sp. SG707]|uniref:hypothetical protein n=1 Tax=Novosphingobium sp. SG707 TaxID=2586996 RepID=UPI001446C598|nr:hypothetical protein [Novosphingobium sp. SG707]NKI99629.1 Cys-tRNA synthase (O-phospho-L-seryl-tRNA:Cys-tRNA synthase) [Novosphingobium sp. SG707]